MAAVPTVLTDKRRYERLKTDRDTFLNRARKCSELTIPTLIPPEGHSASTQYYTPWQGIGARGVNNLASKLLLSLLPPNSPFFRLTVDDFTLNEMAQAPDKRAVVEEGFAKVERAVQTDIEGTGMRSPTFLALKHLIVGGNVTLYLPKEGGMRVYPLDSYVCQRDPMGNVLQTILREEVDPETLTEEERALLSDAPGEPHAEKSTKVGADETVEVFTRIYRDKERWVLYQSINGKEVPGSRGTYPIDKSPVLTLRWTHIAGEDYGRGYVEEYLGDLISLEGLSRAIVEASAASAKVVFLVNPNGITDVEALTEAESGDAIPGTEQDVKALQVEKRADLQVASTTIDRLERRLSQAFLMNSSVQRDGERVTAEEIRYMAGELEDALGGVYSILSQEFQLPLVNRVMDRLIKAKKLPALPKGVVKPMIVTGLEALGRGHDLQKYNAFMGVIERLGPEIAQKYINFGDLLTRVATGLMIDAGGLIKSQDQIMAEEQAAQQAAMTSQVMDIAGKGVGPAIKAVADNAQGQAEPVQ
jgi:hypothetical protein